MVFFGLPEPMGVLQLLVLLMMMKDHSDQGMLGVQGPWMFWLWRSFCSSLNCSTVWSFTSGLEICRWILSVDQLSSPENISVRIRATTGTTWGQPETCYQLYAAFDSLWSLALNRKLLVGMGGWAVVMQTKLEHVLLFVTCSLNRPGLWWVSSLWVSCQASPLQNRNRSQRVEGSELHLSGTRSVLWTEQNFTVWLQSVRF